ncbi:hypothetical protein K1W54_36900, partial [Micromonospora sp. CPCC 205371]|nr:hypothetical protein [Micromonospora sp. CPCC 205371]
GRAEAARWEAAASASGRARLAADAARAREHAARVALAEGREALEAALTVRGARHRRQLNALADLVGALLMRPQPGDSGALRALDEAALRHLGELNRLDEIRAARAATADRAWRARREWIRSAQEREQAGDTVEAAERRATAALLEERALVAEGAAAQAEAGRAEQRREFERVQDAALRERQRAAQAGTAAARYGTAAVRLASAARKQGALPGARARIEEAVRAEVAAADVHDGVLDGWYEGLVQAEEALRRAAWHEARAAHLREVGGNPVDDERRADELLDHARRVAETAAAFGPAQRRAQAREQGARSRYTRGLSAEMALAFEVGTKVAEAIELIAGADSGLRRAVQDDPHVNDPHVNAVEVEESRFAQAEPADGEPGVTDAEIFAALAGLDVAAFAGDVVRLAPAGESLLAVRLPERDAAEHFRAEAADLPATVMSRTVLRAGTPDDPHVVMVTRNVPTAHRPAILPRAAAHEVRHAVLHLTGVDEHLAEVAARETELLVIDDQLRTAGESERSELLRDRRALEPYLAAPPARSTEDLSAWREANLRPGLSPWLLDEVRAIPDWIDLTAATVGNERDALAAASRTLAGQIREHLVPPDRRALGKVFRRGSKVPDEVVAVFRDEAQRVGIAATRLEQVAAQSKLDTGAAGDGVVGTIAGQLRQIRKELHRAAASAKAALTSLAGIETAFTGGVDATAPRALDEARRRLNSAVQTLDGLAAELPGISAVLGTAGGGLARRHDRGAAPSVARAGASPAAGPGGWRYAASPSRLAAVRQLADRIDRLVVEPVEAPLRTVAAVHEELRALDTALTGLRKQLREGAQWPDDKAREALTAPAARTRRLWDAAGALRDLGEARRPLLPEVPDPGSMPGGAPIADVLAVAAGHRDALFTARNAVAELARLVSEANAAVVRALPNKPPADPDAVLTDALAGVRPVAGVAARLATHLHERWSPPLQPLGPGARGGAGMEAAVAAAVDVRPPAPVAELTVEELAEHYAAEPVPAGMVIARSATARAFARMFPAAEGDFAVVVDTVTAPDGELLGFAPPGWPTDPGELMAVAELWELTRRLIELSGRTDVRRVVLVASGAAALAPELHELAARAGVAATVAPRGTVWLAPDGEPFVAATGWHSGLRRLVPAGPDAGWELYTSDGHQGRVELRRPGTGSRTDPGHLVSLVDGWGEGVAAADVDVPPGFILVVKDPGTAPERLAHELRERIARGDLPAGSRQRGLLVAAPDPSGDYGRALAQAWGRPVATGMHQGWLRRDPAGRWRIEGGDVGYEPGVGLVPTARPRPHEPYPMGLFRPGEPVVRELLPSGDVDGRYEEGLAASGARPGPEYPDAPHASVLARGIEFAGRRAGWTRSDPVPGYVDLHVEPDGADAFSPGDLFESLAPERLGEVVRRWHEHGLLGPDGWFRGIRLPAVPVSGYDQRVARLAVKAGVDVLVPQAAGGVHVRYTTDGRIAPFYAVPRPALLARLGEDFMGARGPEPLPAGPPYLPTEYPIGQAHTEALARYGAVRTQGGLALGEAVSEQAAVPGLLTVSALEVDRLVAVLGPMADEGLLGPEGRSARVLLDQPVTRAQARRLARESGLVVVAAEQAGLRDDLVHDGVRRTPDGPVLAPETGRHHEYHPDGTVRPYVPETWTTQRLYLRSGGGPAEAVDVRDEFGRPGRAAAPTTPVMLGPAEPRLPHYEMSLPAAFRHLSGGPPLAPATISVAGKLQRTFPLGVENGKLLMVTDDGPKPLDVVNSLIRVTAEDGTTTTPGTITATDGTLRHVVDRWGRPSQILDVVQRLARRGVVPDPDGLLVFRDSDPDGQLARFGRDVRPATGRRGTDNRVREQAVDEDGEA